MAALLVHKHLIVRAEVKSAPKEPEAAKAWFKHLIEKVNMKIMMGPYAEYCEMKGNRGLTCVAIIETSHCVMHTWDEVDPNIIQFDLYSCGHIDVEAVLEELTQFEPVKIEYKFLDREHGLTEIPIT